MSARDIPRKNTQRSASSAGANDEDLLDTEEEVDRTRNRRRDVQTKDTESESNYSDDGMDELSNQDNEEDLEIDLETEQQPSKTRNM